MILKILRKAYLQLELICHLQRKDSKTFSKKNNHSLRLLERVKERDPEQVTKSGLMVGLGETKEEIMQVRDDMRSAGVDFITIGQYLQPTRKHAAVDRFVTPDEFKALETIARAKGFLMVSASPLTRSSYHAGDDFQQLRAARQAQLKNAGS